MQKLFKKGLGTLQSEWLESDKSSSIIKHAFILKQVKEQGIQFINLHFIQR